MYMYVHCSQGFLHILYHILKLNPFTPKCRVHSIKKCISDVVRNDISLVTNTVSGEGNDFLMKR